MKKLMLVTCVVASAGCMVTTISKDYSVDEVGKSEKLPFNKVENLDDIESFDKSSIPVVVKSESKKEELYSAGGIHGLLWLCTLGIIPSWQTEAETHTMSVATPLGEKSGVCTVTKRRYWGWVPYMLPFGSSEKDVLCEDELLSRLVSQYRQEWTAEHVEKMNVAKRAHIKEFRAKADSLLAQKKYTEVISICKAEKNNAVVAAYASKALRGAVDVALEKKDYQRVVNLCRHAKNDSRLQSKRSEAIVNLIASSTDEAALGKLIKKYGEELSVSQIAEVGEKATNAVVKAKIAEWQKSVAEAADKKIETEIREFFEDKVEGLRKKVEAAKKLRGHCDFSEHYHLSIKDERDVQLLAKLLAKMSNPGSGIDLIQKHNPDDECWEVLISGIREDALVVLLGREGLWWKVRSIIVDRIASPDVLLGLAVNEENATWQYRGNSVGERALAKIDDKAVLVRIALLAKNTVVSKQAKDKIGDKKAIVNGLAELLANKEINEVDVAKHVKVLDDDEATIALYNAANGKMLKQLIFGKLCVSDRKAIRAGDVPKCKQLIDAAKNKSKETFEMGGFYLGMDIADVELLIGYYFPEWSIEESVDSDEEDIRVVYVPRQGHPFCRADKDGKVWQFNFGKSILKKFCKYDVQGEQEWARAYSEEHGINMKHVFLNESTEVADISGNFNVTTYKVWLHQNTWQWKNNAKGYRLVYFGEPDIETVHGNIVKRMALAKFRFKSSDAGTLRVTVEND